MLVGTLPIEIDGLFRFLKKGTESEVPMFYYVQTSVNVLGYTQRFDIAVLTGAPV